MQRVALLGTFKKSHPELYALSKISCTFPVTQVSVERPFSGLKFIILSPHQSKMTDELLEKVLLIRANRIFGL